MWAFRLRTAVGLCRGTLRFRPSQATDRSFVAPFQSLTQGVAPGLSCYCGRYSTLAVYFSPHFGVLSPQWYFGTLHLISCYSIGYKYGTGIVITSADTKQHIQAMATRATYRIIPKGAHPFTLYIHYDGYPAGAAMYFHRAIESQRKTADYGRPAGGKDLPCAFIHANIEVVEFTMDHEIHADTEYRYTYNVETDMMRAEERMDFSSTWRVIYSGSLAGFLSYRWQGSEVPTYYSIEVPTWNGKRRVMITMEQAEQDLQITTDKANEYAAMFPANTGNIHSHQDQVKRAQELLDMVKDARAVAGLMAV
jgi:hypothetical protein